MKIRWPIKRFQIISKIPYFSRNISIRKDLANSRLGNKTNFLFLNEQSTFLIQRVFLTLDFWSPAMNVPSSSFHIEWDMQKKRLHREKLRTGFGISALPFQSSNAFLLSRITNFCFADFYHWKDFSDIWTLHSQVRLLQGKQKYLQAWFARKWKASILFLLNVHPASGPSILSISTWIQTAK